MFGWVLAAAGFLPAQQDWPHVVLRGLCALHGLRYKVRYAAVMYHAVRSCTSVQEGSEEPE